MLAALVVLSTASPASAQTLTWSVVPSPSYLFSSGLSAVSCVSAAACTAVGSAFSSGSAYQTLIESWNGTTWSRVPSPSPGSSGNRLFGVSCVSSAACTAVGYSFTRSGQGTLVESWNGASWSVVPSPTPGADGSSLSAVSCVSAAACTAVGSSFSTGGANQTLVESWNGTTWSVVPSPSPGADGNDLFGVSCISAAACTAVGSTSASSTQSSSTLVESWNGTSWSVVRSPNNPNSANSALEGVSCISAAACTAVGNSSSTAQQSKTLAESWNGTRWSRVPSPSPSSGGNNNLAGVSCVSAAVCTAVGDASRPGSRVGLKTLIESWNGTRWSVVSSPNPLRQDFLKAASCISATACTAVGGTAKGAFKPVTKTLIESATASG